MVSFATQAVMRSTILPSETYLDYIVDFYAPIAKLVIEVDGGQHFEPKGMNQDRLRDESLKQLGLKVLRFNNLEVLQSLDDVVSHIFNQIIYTNPP